MSAAEIVAAVDLPLEVDLGGCRTVTVHELRDVDGLLRADVTLMAGGVELPFSNPWMIGNPPCCVRIDGEAVHDPAAAFREMILTSGFFHG
jgi:hypothetical protein